MTPFIRDPRPAALGGILTANDLPKAGALQRWTRAYKAMIAEATKNGLFSPQEACDRYFMTAAELKRWIELLEAQGLRGLAADNFQTTQVEPAPEPILLDPLDPLAVGIGYLTPNQRRLVSLLVQRAPATVSREDAYAFLFGAKQRAPKGKILDVMICRIRRQFSTGAIETMWGRGWRWNGEQQQTMEIV